MKIFSALIICVALAFNVQGQSKKDLLISGSGGLLNSPYYFKANAQGYYGIDFDYYLSDRHIINAGYFAGQHSYFDNVRSNDPGAILFSNGNNAEAIYHTFSVAYKYKLVDMSFFSAAAGVGAGVLTHTLKFPYKEEYEGNFIQGYTMTMSNSDLVFPVSLDLTFKMSERWQTGVSGGFVIHPDYPILALHAGPKVSYLLP